MSDTVSAGINEFSVSNGDKWEYRGLLGYIDTVYIIGGGHVGQALAYTLEGLPFHPVIIDERERFVFEDPISCRWITCPYSSAHSFVAEGDRSWAVIMTPFHKADAEVLENLAGRNLRYVGMMASSSKRASIYSELLQKGVSREFLDSVHCPVGIPIGSRTPTVIAISIAAQLLGIRSCKSSLL